MKRCPECRRDYYDDTLIYCLDDGNTLLEGPASGDEPTTAILSEPPVLVGGVAPSESPTRPQVRGTDQTVVHPTGAEAEPQKNLGDQPERRSLSANRAAKPQRKMAKQLSVAGLAVLPLAGGFFAYRYFAPPDSMQI